MLYYKWGDALFQGEKKCVLVLDGVFGLTSCFILLFSDLERSKLTSVNVNYSFSFSLRGLEKLGK